MHMPFTQRLPNNNYFACIILVSWVVGESAPVEWVLSTTPYDCIQKMMLSELHLTAGTATLERPRVLRDLPLLTDC